jgi:hypothetical protein
MGTELFHANGQTDRQTDWQAGRQTGQQTDRRTDMTKLTVVFQNFENEPKILDQHALRK